jgi:hypothetical protein
MNDALRRRNDRLVHVSDFGKAHAQDFPANSKGGQALARLNTLLAEIDSRDASAFSNLRVSQQGSSRRKDARSALRAQLADITETAETIGKDHEEVRDKFQRPRTNISDQALLSVARSFAAEAENFKALFIEYDMPADFLDRLNESIGDLAQAIEQQNLGADAGRSDRSSVEHLVKQAEDEMERYETAVRLRYRNDPAALDAWDSARRLERAPRSKKKISPPAPKQ